MNYGMIATGNHGYPDSLRGAPPSPAALIRAAFKLFEPGHFIGIKKERPEAGEMPVPDSIESRSGFRRAGNQQQSTGLLHLNCSSPVTSLAPKKRGPKAPLLCHREDVVKIQV